MAFSKTVHLSSAVVLKNTTGHTVQQALGDTGGTMGMIRGNVHFLASIGRAVSVIFACSESRISVLQGV